ncbi:MAG: hypothetical protein HYZ28_18520 [Myxococcales bacterium]|nr:hypothetical protein [Myxococcales bacterium]
MRVALSVVVLLSAMASRAQAPEAKAGAASAAKPAADAGTEILQLTPKLASDFLDYIEWMMDVALTRAQRDEAQALLEKAWADKNAGEMALVGESVAAHADLSNHSEEDRTALRTSVEDEYVKILHMRYRGQALSRWAQVVHESANKALVPGNVPLTRQTSDAFAELVAFAVGEAGVTKPLSLDRAYRDAFARVLAAEYKSFTDEQKAALGAVQRDWAALRTGWASFPEEKRAQLRAAWKEAFGGLAVALAKGKGAGKVVTAAMKPDASVPAVEPPAIEVGGKEFRATLRELVGKLASWK